MKKKEIFTYSNSLLNQSEVYPKQRRFSLMKYLKIKTQAATRVYASNVPMDMRSTKSFRSNRKAITAAKAKNMLNI